MIALKLEGRLGNQLFQYAFIYSVSKRLNTSFYLDKSVENFILPKYFDVADDFPATLDKHVFSIDGYKNIFRIHLKRTFYSLLGSVLFRGNVIEIDNETPVIETFKKLKNNHLYKGYFHSESYFENVKDELRNLFKIKKPFVDAFEKVKKQFPVSKKKAVLHIRRGDYVDSQLSLPVSYYKKAIEIIGDFNVQYIFISDDPSYVEKEFKYIPGKYISLSDEITDLQFLMNADFCVLSNSSFSWWGAWLNSNKSKQVFAPEFWLGFKKRKEFPTGIGDHMNFNWIPV
jgi:hypothetical protein